MDKINFLSSFKQYNSNYWPQIKQSKKEKLPNNAKNNLKNNFLTSPFISKNMAEKLDKIIQKSSIKKYTYKLKLQQGNVFFHFCSNKPSTFIHKLAKYYFFIIFLRLTYNNKYNSLQFTENVYINIIPVPISKSLSNPMTIDDINSASTLVYPDYYGGPIFIWRLDEIEKVLIHETLHSVHYDADIIKMNLIPELQSYEQKIQMLNINEAYTELCATFIYNIFTKNIKKHLEKELKHSLKNCGRLLQTYNITEFDNLFLENYYQEASAFSYIILRTGLMWLMLDKCKNKDGKNGGLKCLEDFLSIGFWGNIGESYQTIILSIMKNAEFTKKIRKNIEEEKKGRPAKLIMVL